MLLTCERSAQGDARAVKPKEGNRKKKGCEATFYFTLGREALTDGRNKSVGFAAVDVKQKCLMNFEFSRAGNLLCGPHCRSVFDHFGTSSGVQFGVELNQFVNLTRTFVKLECIVE